MCSSNCHLTPCVFSLFFLSTSVIFSRAHCGVLSLNSCWPRCINYHEAEHITELCGLSILPKNCSRLILPTGQEKSDLQCTAAGVSSYSFITPPLRPWVVFSVSQYDDDTHTHAGIVIVSKRQVIECVFRRGSWLIYPTSSVHFCKCELNHLTRSHISNSNNNS